MIVDEIDPLNLLAVYWVMHGF